MDPMQSTNLASPETLDALADAHAGNGDEITARTFRAMAFAWRQTERALATAEAENTLLQGVVNKARREASRLEELAIATHNTLAAGYKVPKPDTTLQAAA